MLNSFLLLIRCMIGLLLIVSGVEKLIGPYQNFLYVVQQYEIFPEILEGVVTRVVPWVELFLGVFLVFGLYLRNSLIATAVLFAGFVFILSQAMIRSLPVTECGCLGELISFPIHVTLMMDCTIFIILLFAIKKISCVSFLSLDQYFQDK
jgi:uncharacterized membrane protein YphA (DoxX/SURF4 family)